MPLCHRHPTSTCLRMLSADPPNVEGARETARRTISCSNRAAEAVSNLRALFSETSKRIETVARSREGSSYNPTGLSNDSKSALAQQEQCACL
jgi:hypothetical protein